MEKTPSPTKKSAIKSLLMGNRGRKTGCSSSSNDIKAATTEQSSDKNTEENVEVIDLASISPNGRNSPDPSCAICLESLQNKSFTNGCHHMFCFKCLVSWSKIKPECPLCKKQFTYIKYNVQENLQCDTYFIRSRSVETYWDVTNTRDHSYGSSSSPLEGTSGMRFRYRTTLTADRIINGSIFLRQTAQQRMQQRIENHRMRYAPHSVRVFSASQSAERIPSSFRRGIYQQNLWVKPVRNIRVRIVSPQFFSQNPACTHRLIPWLNRELTVLLHNETQIAFVLELIMSLITRYDITSVEFFNHIHPYIRKRTMHFTHEFYNFATSPFEMEEYDSHAVYERRYRIQTPSPVSDSSISDEELIDVDTMSSNEILDLETETSMSNNILDSLSPSIEAVTQNNLSRTNQLKKMILKRNPGTDAWVTVSNPLPFVHNSNNINHNYSNPGPSTSSGFSSRNFSLYDAPSMSISPFRFSSSDDDCQIVHEVKPKNERTPEIIDILSDDEPSLRIVDSSSVENNDYNQFQDSETSDVSVITFIRQPHRRRSDSSSSVECLYTFQPLNDTSVNESNSSHIHSPVRNSPVDLSSKKSSKRSPLHTSGQRETSVFNITSRRNSIPFLSDHESISEPPLHVKESLSHPEKSDCFTQYGFSLPSKIVVPKTRANQSNSNTSSSSKNCFGAFLDDSSTESNSSVPRKKKKLRLKSVVAHFSFEKNDEKTDSSRHKKRKEKKKKKKHSRKHKYRIYSDTESSS